MSKPEMTGASDAEVIALLKRYKCPVLRNRARDDGRELAPVFFDLRF